MVYLRSATLRGLRAVIAELGGDADELARAAGLSPACLDDDEMIIPAAAAAGILELAAARLACPDLGLRVAKRQSVSIMGALGVALIHSPTFGEALDVVHRYLSVHTRAVSLELGPDPLKQPGTLGLRYLPATFAGPAQAVDLGLGFIHRGLEFLNHGPYGLRGVLLPYPSLTSQAVYEDFYGAPVHTGNTASPDAAVLRVPADLPRRRLPTADATGRQLALALLDRAVPAEDPTAHVRAAISQALQTGSADQSLVAELLGVSPRTLQRRLRNHGTSYRTELDEVRRVRALELITTTTLPLGYVAILCGFAEQASFTRAAYRWWGTAPSTLRRFGAAPPAL